MVLAAGLLIVLALIFGPSLWVKMVMRRYSSEKPEMRGTGGELAKHLIERFSLKDKSNERIYIVHNGIIENYIALKEFLKEEGYSFSSQTDSELIAHMLEYFLNKSNSMLDSMYLTIMKR